MRVRNAEASALEKMASSTRLSRCLGMFFRDASSWVRVSTVLHTAISITRSESDMGIC